MCAIDKLTNNYIKEIKQNLLCPVRQKKQVLKDIEISVKDFAESKKITDINELYTHFGTPEDVAAAYMPQADIKELKRKIKLRKTAIFVAITVIAIIFALCIDAFLETYPFRQPVIHVFPAVEGTTGEPVSDEVLL